MSALLVELVGPPGAGKSTVFARLLESDRRLEPAPILRRRPATAALLAWHLAGAVMALLRHRALGRHWTFEGVVMMAYLRALPPVLRRGPARVVVFDQGPIYALMRPSMRDPRLAAWTARRFEEWRALLDVVVSLDAPDDVLVERIDDRPKAHRLKGAELEAALRSLSGDRATIAAALARLDGGPVIVRADTSRSAADEIARDVLAALP